MNSFQQVATAKKPKAAAGKRAIEHMRIEPADNGGAVVSTHYKAPKGSKGYSFEEPERNVFGNADDAAAHVKTKLAGCGKKGC